MAWWWAAVGPCWSTRKSRLSRAVSTRSALSDMIAALYQEHRIPTVAAAAAAADVDAGFLLVRVGVASWLIVVRHVGSRAECSLHVGVVTRDG